MIYPPIEVAEAVFFWADRVDFGLLDANGLLLNQKTGRVDPSANNNPHYNNLKAALHFSWAWIELTLPKVGGRFSQKNTQSSDSFGSQWSHPHITSSIVWPFSTPPPPSSSIVITLQTPLPQIWYHQNSWFLCRDSSTSNSIIGWLILSSHAIWTKSMRKQARRAKHHHCLSHMSSHYMGYPSTPGCCRLYAQ